MLINSRSLIIYEIIVFFILNLVFFEYQFRKLEDRMEIDNEKKENKKQAE